MVLVSSIAGFVVGYYGMKLYFKRRRRLAAERAVKIAEEERAWGEAISASMRARIQLQMAIAQQQMAQQYARIQYEAAYARETQRAAEEQIRAANRNGSIDSSCYEVEPKKLLN